MSLPPPPDDHVHGLDLCVDVALIDDVLIGVNPVAVDVVVAVVAVGVGHQDRAQVEHGKQECKQLERVEVPRV